MLTNTTSVGEQIIFTYTKEDQTTSVRSGDVVPNRPGLNPLTHLTIKEDDTQKFKSFPVSRISDLHILSIA